MGGAIARALGRAGCNCLCHCHSSKDKAQELVKEICTPGTDALAVGADLTKPDEIERLFAEAAQLGTPQILINSAAVFSGQPLQQVTLQEAQKVLDLNLTAAILTSRVFAKTIKDKFGDTGTVIGKIINLADVGGIRPWAGYVLYCSSKAGLIGATKALAKELAPAVCVNAVAPGVVNWPVDFSEEQKQQLLKLIPLGRTASPEDITDAIIFLLDNDYITGQVLNVDGGRCI